jgi:hypothetical protein
LRFNSFNPQQSLLSISMNGTFGYILSSFGFNIESEVGINGFFAPFWLLGTHWRTDSGTRIQLGGQGLCPLSGIEQSEGGAIGGHSLTGYVHGVCWFELLAGRPAGRSGQSGGQPECGPAMGG